MRFFDWVTTEIHSSAYDFLVKLYLMARHDICNPDLRLQGGPPRCYPVWGDFGRLRILNWATKFLVDALALEQRIST